MANISLNFADQLIFEVDNNIIEFTYNITENDSNITLNKPLNINSNILIDFWKNLQTLDKTLPIKVICLNDNIPFLEKYANGANYQIGSNLLNTGRFNSDLLESVIINLQMEE